MKIFLVEGTDGSGKTTLINNLKEKYNDVNSVHTIPRDWLQFEKSADLWQYLLGKVKSKMERNNIVLIDRSFITDFVYRMCIDIDKPSMEFNAFAYLMYNYDLKIIYCTSKDAYIKANNRGETYVKDIVTHSKICGMYEHFMETMKMLGIPVVKYDYMVNKIDDLYKKLKEI